MIGYDVLTVKESGKWRSCFNKLPRSQQDVYFTPEYYSLYENLGAGQAVCFVYHEKGDMAIYPFLMNSVNDLGFSLDRRYFDIQGAYGYNGVATSTNSQAFKDSFASAIEAFAAENSVIAEFTRFNPVLGNHLFSQYLSPVYNQKNVIVDLRVLDMERECYEHATRKNIKKAERNHLVCSRYDPGEMTEATIKEFLAIYYATMKRSGAERSYYFPFSYFREVAERLTGRSVFYFVHHGKTLVATELVMRGESIAYSFLGGTLADYFELRPNDFLKDYIIRDLRARDMDYFCLGGGSDGILRYKKKFCKNGEVDFHIGKKIHDAVTFNEVAEQWEQKYPEKSRKYKNYFLKYRFQ